jgi:N-acetylneuraminate synthase
MSSTLTKIFSSPNQNSPKSNFNDIYFIAEIGINHNGDINLAKELIHIAKNAGCDAVKFQKRTIEIVYSQAELKKFRESPWGSTQLDQKKGLEFSKTEYDIIDKY